MSSADRARDDVRSALIAAATVAFTTADWPRTEGRDWQPEMSAVVDALPRPLLLRFAWEGLSEAEREAATDAAYAALCEDGEPPYMARIKNYMMEPHEYEGSGRDREADKAAFMMASAQAEADNVRWARAAIDAALMTGGEDDG